MTSSPRQQALTVYRELKKRLGQQPSSRQFFREGMSKRRLDKAFGSNAYSKMVKAAGDTPMSPVHIRANPWTKERILDVWGRATRQLKRPPTQADWNHRGLEPSVGTVEKKVGRWSEVPVTFAFYADGNPAWADVLRLLRKETQTETSNSSPPVDPIDDFRAFIPPAIGDLASLSTKDGSHLEFEKKVNLAFQLLGFQVQALGQGTGRNSDGIAIDRENHYAILLDAKARKDGYSLGTDDRAFIEYVRASERDLRSQGIDHIYFVVVSSRFRGGVNKSARKLKTETMASALVLLPAELLLELVASKIQNPLIFKLGELKNFLAGGGILEAKEIRSWTRKLTDSS